MRRFLRWLRCACGWHYMELLVSSFWGFECVCSRCGRHETHGY